MDLVHWQQKFRSLAGITAGDLAHDLAHIERVVNSAIHLAQLEDANLAVVLPAAYLHDCVYIPKTSPQRAKASILAADRAAHLLRKIGYDDHLIQEIHDCIVAHSYSASITPTTIEAKDVQDADRLDALGAIGIARCFATTVGHHLYCDTDPFCKTRKPDDTLYTLDHFYSKLLRLPDTLQTTTAREEAGRRIEFMKSFLQQLSTEII